MKTPIYFITSTLLLFACTQSTISTNKQKREQLATDTIRKIEDQLPYSIHPHKLFILSDAEKIMGEPAHLTDSTYKNKGQAPGFKDSMSIYKNEAATYSIGYMANAKDIKTEKIGNFYFTYEDYPQLSSAKKVYTYYKTANEKNGIEVLHNIGDEAYFHTDKKNFYFIMVRKVNVVFNMKVNKITSKTSLEEFNRVAKRISSKM